MIPYRGEGVLDILAKQSVSLIIKPHPAAPQNTVTSVVLRNGNDTHMTLFEKLPAIAQELVRKYKSTVSAKTHVGVFTIDEYLSRPYYGYAFVFVFPNTNEVLMKWKVDEGDFQKVSEYLE